MESKNFVVFTRTWWKNNPNWPNGLEPHLGKKRVLRRNLSESEAKALCKEWNATNKPGKFSRKAEFTTE